MTSIIRRHNTNICRAFLLLRQSSCTNFPFGLDDADRRITSRCMTLSLYFQQSHSAMQPVQTTFSCAHGPSLFSQGKRPCRLFGRSADPNPGRRCQQGLSARSDPLCEVAHTAASCFHSLRSGSPRSRNSSPIWRLMAPRVTRRLPAVTP